MASSFDKPLDEFLYQRGRGGGGFYRRGRGGGYGRGSYQQRGRGGGGGGFYARRGGGGPRFGGKFDENGFQSTTPVKEGGGSGGGGVSDLRDVIISKTKPSVTDLRLKLPPKQLTSKKGGGGGGGRPVSSGSKSGRTNKQQNMPSRSFIDQQQFFQQQPPQRSTTSNNPRAGPRNPSFNDKSPPAGRRLPTSSEAKKITITVQGLNKTTSEMYRKEERLAMAITRQKETRQQNFMKSREEFIASSITSALGGGGGGMPSQVHSAVRTQPPQQSYSRHHRESISPNEYHFEPRQYDQRPLAPPMSAPPRQRSAGLTTVTTLVISNLNDTVSRNDVYELCTAVGPLENVAMIAPGVAEVTYRYKDDALEAFKKYNQRNLDGMPMVCRLQPGVGSMRGRGAMNMSMGGYGGRMMDPYQPEGPSHSSLFNTGGSGMDGFY